MADKTQKPKKNAGKGAPSPKPVKKDPVEFWFDFSSPYAYIASTLIDDIAEEYGRTVTWRPFLLGPIMKQSGNQPLLHQPLKGDYTRRDAARLARFFEVPFTLPDPFPIAALAATRGFYWLEETAPDAAVPFAIACLERYYVDGQDISQPEEVAAAAETVGVDANALLAAVADQQWKDKAKTMVEEAMTKGVCGSPFFFVDGEPFWGADRLWMVEEWLQSGGW